MYLRTHIKSVFLSGRTTKRGKGVIRPEPLRKKRKNYFKKNMISAGQYQSTEKGYE